MKKLLLFLSRSKRARRWVEKWRKLLGVHRFIAGETIEEALTRIQDLNREGFCCTLDYLGENTLTKEDATTAKYQSILLLRAIHEQRVDCNLSLKLTQLGLDIDSVLCEENLRGILEESNRLGIFVRIDMEDYHHCQLTLDLLRRVSQDYNNVGTVIQAYLYRSLRDVKNLQAFSLRLVKGAYLESESVSFKRKRDVDTQFKQMIALHLQQGSYTAIATHDEKIIEFAQSLVHTEGLGKEKYEFQMLYGIRTGLQKKILSQGYKIRLYVPFGQDWYGYFMRRLAERPANVWFVLKGVIKK